MTARSETAVSIVIPTLNGGHLLRRCLDSILGQDFPRERLEILVMDGGSTDGTRELAADLGCTVVDNPRRLAEPGVRLGLARAAHDIKIVLAADNGLPGRDWLSRVTSAFEDGAVRGTYTHVTDGAIDSSFCRYFNRLHADPFNWFVFGPRAANPRRFGELYPRLASGDGWTVYDLRAGDPPLLALAQGFALRGPLPEGESDQDDILPLWRLIDEGEQFAYVDVGVLHHTVTGFGDFLRKYRRRAQAALSSTDAPYRMRNDRLSARQRRRRLLWVPYACSLVLPLGDALRGLRRDRDAVWLWHPVACLSLGAVMTAAVVRHLSTRVRR